ncbi:lipopolysaccharide transport system permease protein [Cnuella takakiae]|uniref:Transport permease protein n=1 Tax=Cnuella takakiae TaxID=1302690 RepID=A0A1M5DR96_9BACT|nr:ABC transporter permease [Cnuella takakiae]OLY93897.1 ABC transporter permease [Cnuella takakiae]SHF69480.1 lipopolysaccharide transport system permease protein [Cnuella takakiae]
MNTKTIALPAAEVEPLHQEAWTEVIVPRSRLLDLRLGELWRYRDLVLMLVRRDFVANYKQTILGPLWFLVQPILTVLTFVLIFGRVAGLSTDGMPKVLFYLAGVTLWNYFAETLNKTATVFRDNSPIFGKVYFPRLTMPVSIVISNLVRLAIQYGLFLVFWAWYLWCTSSIHPNACILLTPLLILNMGLLALGLGMIISALTTRYRDLVFLLTFGIQLLMYATPVIYPFSSIASHYKWLLQLNPMTAVVETFRYAYLGSGTFSLAALTYSMAISIGTVLLGTIVFNKVEKSFTDTV